MLQIVDGLIKETWKFLITSKDKKNSLLLCQATKDFYKTCQVLRTGKVEKVLQKF